MNEAQKGIYRNKGLLLIDSLIAKGKRTFTTEDAQKELDIPRSNVLAILGHLGRQRRILSLSRGFYAVWPPAERKQGLHPLPIVDALMRFRKIHYYVGLLSAADRYGAAHHKPQLLQVVLPRQIRLRKAQKLGISLHTHKRFPIGGIISVKSSSGPVFFSSAELTLLDIFYFESACGGFGNVSLIARDLLPHLQAERFKEVIKIYPYMASLQRAGYLLEFFGANRSLLGLLIQSVTKRSPVPVGLSSGSPKKGELHKKWGIIQNAPVEVEP